MLKDSLAHTFRHPQIVFYISTEQLPATYVLPKILIKSINGRTIYTFDLADWFEMKQRKRWKLEYHCGCYALNSSWIEFPSDVAYVMGIFAEIVSIDEMIAIFFLTQKFLTRFNHIVTFFVRLIFWLNLITCQSIIHSIGINPI